MGKLFGGLLNIFGLGGGQKPQVSGAAAKEVTADAATSKGARASLYATAGGVQGEDLNPDQVKKRQTLLGN